MLTSRLTRKSLHLGLIFFIFLQSTNAGVYQRNGTLPRATSRSPQIQMRFKAIVDRANRRATPAPAVAENIDALNRFQRAASTPLHLKNGLLVHQGLQRSLANSSGHRRSQNVNLRNFFGKASFAPDKITTPQTLHITTAQPRAARPPVNQRAVGGNLGVAAIFKTPVQYRSRFSAVHRALADAQPSAASSSYGLSNDPEKAAGQGATEEAAKDEKPFAAPLKGDAKPADEPTAPPQILQKPAASAGEPQIQKAQKNSEIPAKITVHAEQRGTPYINFQDGKELPINAQQSSSQASPHLLATADFDSDGVADLVTADSSGMLKFYRGNLDAQFPNSAKAKKHQAEGTFIDSPFYPSETSFALGLNPDFLVVGDFNTDGKKDILAVAKNDSRIQLLRGDGRGNFAAPQTLTLAGKVTQLVSGEIGRPDGQSDLVIAVQNDKSSQLLVFAHPEGAFKHKPEIITLPAPATDIAIGNLDEDYYADIAVACGEQLVVIHGRGQAYPWDLVPESGIKRPNPVVATRKMPFAISAMAVGRFGEKRGQTLAMLSTDGNIYRLEPNRKQAPSNNKLPATALGQTKPVPFVPTDAEPRSLATLAEPAPTPGKTTDAFGMPLIDMNAAKGRNFQEYLRELLEQAAKDAPKPDKQAIAKLMAEGAQQKAELTERAKAAFLRSLAARPSTLASWQIETLVSGSPFAKAAAASGHGQKLQRAKVSSSNLDDLMIIDSATNQIHLAAKLPPSAGHNQFDVASLDVEGEVQAVLAMRLNVDALSDLVVLRKGAPAPSVVLSAPANDFTVNSTTDFGDCIDANPCSLRNAILLANSSPGLDFITFDFGGVQTTISPASELPAITDAVVFLGPTDGNNHPTVEISGANVPAPADGLKIRGSNITIQSLVVNRFQGVTSGGSQIGGNGVTIETPLGLPTSSNNFLIGNYLGTDITGLLDRGNSATGLNIFDADDNFIGSTVAPGGNVMSGNGTPTTFGVGISMTAGNNNRFNGNLIGLNAAGNAKLGNGNGLFFSGANNAFGGDSPGDGNTVSGNGLADPNSPGQCLHIGNGVFSAAMFIVTLVDQNTNELLTLNNNLAGNFFGTNPGGTLPLGNCYGAILTSPLTQTTIGSIAQGGRNIVADNGFEAIACDEEIFTQSEGGFCAIAGNNIGTDVTGTIAMPNDFRNYAGGLDRSRGIVDIAHNMTYSYFGAPGGTTPGGACTGFCNLYSGNGGFGNIYFTGRGTMGFFNNYIGTNQQGNQAIPNYDTSALEIGNILFGEVFIGAVGIDDNNAPVSLGNLISGNPTGALNAFTFSSPFPGAGYFSSLNIQGNRIGTDASGVLAIPNSDISNPQPTISLIRGFTEPTLIGGAHPLARNIISGNHADGIVNFAFPGYPTPITITNNLIGVNALLNPLGNGGNGIFVFRGLGIQIGGPDGEANHIAYNGTAFSNSAGILVARDATGIKIRNNSIHDNAGLGIDLSNALNNADGVTLNDICEKDADLGANYLQNFPVLFTPTFDQSGNLTLTGTLRSTPFHHFTIDLYSSSTSDGTGHGEGETYLGSVDVTVDGNGFGQFSFMSTSPVSQALSFSATATDDLGNTSEFSCNAGQTCEGVPQFHNLAEYKAFVEQSCPASIVVNIETDQPDQNAADGVCDVDTSTDGLQCSLRAALQVVTSPDYVGPREITFDIPGPGVHTISPATPLPEIDHPVRILADTQPGSTSRPMIELSGAIQSDTTGLFFGPGSDNSLVRGLIINRFPGSGVIFRSNGNTLEFCWVGLLASGMAIDQTGSQRTGVQVIGRGNIIGSNNDHDANFITGNSEANIRLFNSATDTSIFGNFIGMFSDRQTFVTGPFDGILLEQGASFNTIGGLHGAPAKRNVIIGAKAGIDLLDGANGNTVLNNVITQNLFGVLINRSSGNHIGMPGNGSQLRNVIYENVVGIQMSEETPSTAVNRNAYASREAATKAIIEWFESLQTKRPAGLQINTHDNTVANNLIGPPSGENSTGNAFGIVLLTAQTNFIGLPSGTSGSGANFIFESLHAGVFLSYEASHNFCRSNVIGLNPFSGEIAPNEDGFDIRGDTNELRGNTITGNQRHGIFLVAEFEGQNRTPDNNTIIENKIGTNSSGAEAIGNGSFGVWVEGTGNQIGLPGLGNVISGNGMYGIELSSKASESRVAANMIGVDAAGENSLANISGGIEIRGSNNVISDNTISGNGSLSARAPKAPHATSAGGDGILIKPFLGNLSGSFNRIENNRIGTNREGTSPIPNQGSGVAIKAIQPDGTCGSNSAGLNVIGGLGLGNVISGNAVNGVELVCRSTNQNTIQGNKIGTDASGTNQITNGRAGIFISESFLNDIGGFGANIPAARNIISGNMTDGIRIEGGAFANTIKGNYIGVAADGLGPLGNGGNGVYLASNSSNNFIGGDEQNAGNVIANNGRNGVAAAPDAGIGILIDPNSIFANAMHGISLNEPADPEDPGAPPPVPVPNDPGDADTGPNNLQNYPEFVSATINTNGDLVLQYKVDSAPANSNYGANGLYIEFFKADQSPNLQGQTFIGSSHYTTGDYNNGTPGIATFNAGNAASLGIAVGDKLVATATDADGNTSEFTSVNIGLVGSPTLAKLERFTAVTDGSQVLINWQTGFEVDNLGFHLYREVDGQRQRITTQLIAGSALSDGAGTALLSGHTYYWTDAPPAGKSVRYYLEDIDLSGKATLNGPFVISSMPPKDAAEAQRRSDLITQIGGRQALLANGLGAVPLERFAPLAAPSGAALQTQLGLAPQAAIKISVQREGFYRISQAALVSAGLDAKSDPRLLQLFADGIEQAIKVNGEQDGRFDPADSLEFYGAGLNTPSTDRHVYWLVAGRAPGKRLTMVEGNGAATSASGFPATVERRDRTVYFSSLRNGEAENFFGAVIANQPVDQSLTLTNLNRSAGTSATLEISLQGVTQKSHNVRVQLNGTDLTRLNFSGQALYKTLVAVNPGLLKEGENTVRLMAETEAGDISLVDVLRLNFSHSFRADGNTLKFTAKAGDKITVGGFTAAAIRLFDITDVNSPSEIKVAVLGNSGNYQISAGLPASGERTLLALADSQLKSPAALVANQPSNWRNPKNAADLLIVTNKEFFPALEPLKAVRSSQGLTVALIDIEDLYDEFAFGNKSPQALKDFFAYAAREWQQAPRFVLLAGKASYDGRNYLGLGNVDFVPTKLIDTQYMETASDDELVDFNSDGLAELAIGRLPFRNLKEARVMIDKLINYEKSAPSPEALLVADRNDGFNFEQAAAELAGRLPSTIHFTQINRGQVGTPAAKIRLLEALNRGPKIVNYGGHGSVNLWRDHLLSADEAAQLQNREHLSLFVMMTCLNGYFADPGLESLSNELLNAPQGGAVGVWASSALTSPDAQHLINLELYKQLFSSPAQGKTGGLRLGEALLKAKAATTNLDVRRSWILLGDPSMSLK